jgi:hypothetical protein
MCATSSPLNETSKAHHPDIFQPRDAYTDIHNKLMLAYSEVSELWFVAVLVISVSTPSTDGSHKLKKPHHTDRIRNRWF